jgi:AcrR family transcriptional regulator
MSPKKINVDEKKILIIKTAINVFSEKGIHRTRMADISKKAGFSYGLVYTYFKNQEDLLIQTYTYLYETLMEDFLNEFKPCINSSETIISMVNLFSKSIMKMDHKIAMLFMDFWVEGIRGHKQYNEFLNKNFIEFRTMLSEIIKSGIEKNEFVNHNIEHSATAIMALMDGNQFYHMTIQNSYNFQKQLDFSIQLLLKGIKKV